MKVKLLESIDVLPGANGGAYSPSRVLYHRIKYNPEKVIESWCPISESIETVIDEKDRGGVIIMSTDVNAIQASENKIVNWFKQKFETMKNRLTATSRIDKIAQDNELMGWTIGHYLDGRYTAKNGTPFGENSLSIMILGVKTETLVKIAEELCREFNQEAVLVKDFSSGNILVVNGQ